MIRKAGSLSHGLAMIMVFFQSYGSFKSISFKSYLKLYTSASNLRNWGRIINDSCGSPLVTPPLHPKPFRQDSFLRGCNEVAGGPEKPEISPTNSWLLDGLQPTSNGQRTHSCSDGFQPTSDGLQPTSPQGELQKSSIPVLNLRKTPNWHVRCPHGNGRFPLTIFCPFRRCPANPAACGSPSVVGSTR